ncbi:galanin receptor 2b-like [Lytechinus pictus]|uniref:galanin receptor 2b-like n=1 Tax=Lytechinus pictus TaxID=7653 RepID=UPI0030BA1277
MDNSTELLATSAIPGSRDLSTSIIYTVFGIFGIVGNGLVLLVIAQVENLRGVTNLFIANQSVIDFSSSIVLIANFVVPLPHLPSDQPILAEFLCRFWYTKYFFWSLIVASSLNLVLMTLPMRYRSYTNTRRLKFVAVLPWMIGFLFQLAVVCYTILEDNQCVLYWSYWEPVFFKVFGSMAVFLEFLLPLIVIIIVYSSIAVRLSHSCQRSEVKLDPLSRSKKVVDYRNRATKNIIKTMMFVSIFFIICWFLNQVVVFALISWGGNVDPNGILYRISVFMGFGNMCINPIIYSFQYHWFQKGLKKLFCKNRRGIQSQAIETVSGTTKNKP